MTLVGYDILKSEDGIRDDGAELFFKYFLNRSVVKDPLTGIVAFTLNKKPFIAPGEPYVQYCWTMGGEELVTNYSLYSYRMCLKYNIYEQFFKTELFNTKDIIHTLTRKKYEIPNDRLRIEM